MYEDKTPKVFSSYSWSSDEIVVPLAERLMSHGVEVVLDKWDLKEGQDKYEFMERCVNDQEITKVLIVCDKRYADKANSRTGGVGDETVIISGEIYGNMRQEKFIPIIAERDSEGNAYVPTYIKTRIYIDLSNDETYEVEYEKLLRNIYQKPLFSKPKLGRQPEWLDADEKNFFPVKDLLRQIRGSKTEKKQRSCTGRFIEEYINLLKGYFVKGIKNGKQVYDCFVEMERARNIFLDFLPILEELEFEYAEILCDAFEKMYNSLTCIKAFEPTATSASDRDFDIYKIHIWELFVCTIAFLRNIQDYKTINALVCNTYFLSSSCLDQTIQTANYCRFRHHSFLVEDDYKPTTPEKNKFTLLGNTLCCEREKLPVYTREAIAEADLFLYQICKAFQLADDESFWGNSYWFPTCYVYAQNSPCEWKKMKSRKFCTKMFVLFGVSSIEELKEAIKKCEFERDMRYNGSFNSAPAILSCIKIEEIGSVN